MVTRQGVVVEGDVKVTRIFCVLFPGSYTHGEKVVVQCLVVRIT